jgi:hypothetical protein
MKLKVQPKEIQESLTNALKKSKSNIITVKWQTPRHSRIQNNNQISPLLHQSQWIKYLKSVTAITVTLLRSKLSPTTIRWPSSNLKNSNSSVTTTIQGKSGELDPKIRATLNKHSIHKTHTRSQALSTRTARTRRRLSQYRISNRSRIAPSNRRKVQDPTLC